MKNSRLKGSVSLETALVMPVVLFIVISLIYMTFYLHDRMLLMLCSYNSGIESVFENKSLHSTAKKKVEELNTLTIVSTSVWTEEEEIKVKYKGNFSVPFTALSPFIQNEKVEEENGVCGKMSAEKMYIVKVVTDTIEEE